MKVALQQVDNGDVLEEFEVLLDDLLIGSIRRERQLPDNPKGVWVGEDIFKNHIGETDTVKQKKEAVGLVLGNFSQSSS